MFVITNSFDRFWTGSFWSKKSSRAIRFVSKETAWDAISDIRNTLAHPVSV